MFKKKKEEEMVDLNHIKKLIKMVKSCKDTLQLESTIQIMNIYFDGKGFDFYSDTIEETAKLKRALDNQKKKLKV